MAKTVVMCPYCGEEKNLQGMLGHVRWKHGDKLEEFKEKHYPVMKGEAPEPKPKSKPKAKPKTESDSESAPEPKPKTKQKTKPEPKTEPESEEKSGGEKGKSFLGRAIQALEDF